MIATKKQRQNAEARLKRLVKKGGVIYYAVQGRPQGRTVRANLYVVKGRELHLINSDISKFVLATEGKLGGVLMRSFVAEDVNDIPDLFIATVSKNLFAGNAKALKARRL